MKTAANSLNPFSLMMEPEAVLQAMERSQSLRGLRRRTLRPLDKPLIPYVSRVVDALDTDMDDCDLDTFAPGNARIELND